MTAQQHREREDGWNRKRFAELRAEFSPHYADFASACQVSEQTARNWEYMPRGPQAKYLGRVLRVLQVSTGWTYERLLDELLTVPRRGGTKRTAKKK